jgi:hypothetical protein
MWGTPSPFPDPRWLLGKVAIANKPASASNPTQRTTRLLVRRDMNFPEAGLFDSDIIERPPLLRSDAMKLRGVADESLATARRFRDGLRRNRGGDFYRRCVHRIDISIVRLRQSH